MTAPGGVRRWTWYEKLRYAEEGEWPKRGATILVPKAELDVLAAKLAYYEKPFNDRGETEAQWVERNIYENRQKNEDLAANEDFSPHPNIDDVYVDEGGNVAFTEGNMTTAQGNASDGRVWVHVRKEGIESGVHFESACSPVGYPDDPLHAARPVAAEHECDAMCDFHDHKPAAPPERCYGACICGWKCRAEIRKQRSYMLNLDGSPHTCPDHDHRAAPPDAPAPLSHDAGEAVKRIIDSMEPPDAQPEAGEEIVLHRTLFASQPGEWHVCKVQRHEDDEPNMEHAVWTRRKP